MTEPKKPNPAVDQTRFSPAKKTGQTSIEDKEHSEPSSNSKLDIKAEASEVRASNSDLEQSKSEMALTQIRSSIREQDDSKGFVQAQKLADEALADDQIVLNKRFVLESTLGAGGMGTVYKARDLRKVEANDLNPNIAVKVLNEDFKNHPDAFVTLQREASRSHKLSHPNIVTVHDFDRHGNIIYMTMELLEGEGLDQQLRKHEGKGFPLEQAFSIIRDYCRALSYAHHKEIIHSDLKPGNIYICKESCKVLDFGIARISNQSAASDDFDAGTLGALTPAYASLEMINEAPPHPSDDVYAAAIIAYELLTGKHPYDRKPADKALAEALKPARIKSLSKKQWRALESALQLRRIERTQSIDEFSEGLFKQRRSPIYKIASAILLPVVFWLAYSKFFAPNELTQVIDTTYAQGSECFNQKEFECAIESALSVLKLEPDHQGAEQLLSSAQHQLQEIQLDKLSKQLNACIVEQKDVDCAKQVLLQMQELDPEAPSTHMASSYLLEFEQEQLLLNALTEAENCFNDQDYQCAIEQAHLALKEREDSQAAKDILKRAKLAQKKQREAQKQLTVKRQNAIKKHDAALSKARKCFAKKELSCAEKNVKLALKYKNSSQARTLRQQVKFALQQQQVSQSKADNILRKGKACFERKDYSCAIASSESALEFVPNYRPAINLKQKARNAINDLKKQIIIN